MINNSHLLMLNLIQPGVQVLHPPYSVEPTPMVMLLQADPAPSQSVPFFAFPVELAQDILSFCHPWDVATFSMTCRSAYSLVYHPTDQYLWRQLYAAYPFDPPHNIPDASLKRENIDWKNELTTRMKVELALYRGPMSSSQRSHVLRTLATIIEDSSWAGAQFGSECNTNWLKGLIRNSLLLHNIYSVPEGSEDAQAYARLRAYLASTLLDDTKHNIPTHTKLLDKRDFSRACVYNLLNYSEENKWGPFLSDGRVNWVHVEHLVGVVALNIRELPGNWAFTRPPTCLERPRSSPRALVPGGVNHDWAGVEGTWRRYVSFMDYRDLFAFNFTDLADGPRHPKFFKDPRFREATRLIELKLVIVPPHKTRFHRVPDASAGSCETYKPLFFSGTSKGVNGNEASIEGSVVMGKDGIARWQLISIYDNNPQWSSNGVQIGGLRSAMGIIGVWTTTIHDQDDPAGPFWLWKVDENAPTHLMEFT